MNAFPDYSNSLVSLAQSVLGRFHAGQTRPGLRLAEPHLNKKNVVVLLLDGMGTQVMALNLEPSGFFAQHRVGDYSSVFPPTTVAATTSLRSGQTPMEHAWLGWDCYYPQIDKNVTVFRNTLTGTNIAAADYNVAETYCPYDSILNKINRCGGQAYEVSPFAEPHPQTFDEFCARIEELCAQDGEKYIYAYWAEPDHTLHELGNRAEQTRTLLRELEQKVEALSEKLADTVLLVTADHGHVNAKGVSIGAYPAIMDCLVRGPSIESRAVNFFVKPEKKADFEREFQKEFGEKFLLLTHRQVVEQKLFGDGQAHQNFEAMLGDYLALAVSDLCIFGPEERDFPIGVHAGLTQEELTIPLIVIER